MENTETQNNIAESVLQKINNGEVKKRSKYYFVLKLCIFFFFTFLIFISSVLLVSYLLFSIKAGGHIFLLSFGAKGVYNFLIVLPWFLLILNAGLIIFLDYFLRRFKFGYNSPMLYLFLGTLVSVTLFSFIFNYTSFHKKMMQRAEQNGLFIGNGLYRNIPKSHKSSGIIKGEVVSIGENFLVIRQGRFSVDNATSEEKVIFPKEINLASFVEKGEEVFIALDVASGTEIRAYGVHRIKDR